MNQSSISESDRKDDLEDADSESTEQAGADQNDGIDADGASSDVDDRIEDAVLEAEGASHVDDAAGPGFAATALKFLILVLVIFGLSLWLVPMLAPHLPASVAKHLMPGQHAIDTQIAEIRGTVDSQSEGLLKDLEAMKGQLSDLTTRLAASEEATAAAKEEAAAARDAAAKSAEAALTSATSDDVLLKAEAAAKEASEMARTATTAATEAGKVASASTRDTASLARQMTSFEARMAGLSDEIGAMTESLASTPTDEGSAASPELVAAFSALKARVDSLGELTSSGLVTREDADRFATQDDLRSTRTALEAQTAAALGTFPEPDAITTTDALNDVKSSLMGKISDLSDRIGAAEATVKTAADTASAAQDAADVAVGKVDNAIKLASMRSAIAAMTSRMDAGASFASALSELEELSGTLAPAALGKAAQAGVATPAALLRSFGRPAQQAVAAEIKASSGDDVFSQASAKLRSVVAGRPKSEQSGDDAAAILSRAEARLRDGLTSDALAEVEALADAPKAALGTWLERLRARAAAEQTREEYLAEISGSQG